MLIMKEAQAKCQAWRERGGDRFVRAADRLEAKYIDHSDYESDAAWLLRVQSGEQVLLSHPKTN